MRKIKLKSGNIHLYKADKYIFGFSERGICKTDIADYFNTGRIRELNQIHSSKILFSDKIVKKSEGDGIILNETNTLVIIKTADCVPLFFYSDKGEAGGILHCGWRGCAGRIDNELLRILDKSLHTKPGDLNFF
jgi:copper oxidase (laccase) domain-containing protein